MTDASREEAIIQLRAESLGLQCVLGSLCAVLAKSNPAIIKEAFDASEHLLNTFAVQVGREAPPQFFRTAAEVVEMLRPRLEEEDQPKGGI